MIPPQQIRPTACHPSFWRTTEVSADSALLDKCDLVLGGWRFEAGRNQVSHLVPILSKLQVPCGGGKTTRLFENRSADDIRYSHTLIVRGAGAGEGVQYPHPTFSGYLKLRESTRDDGEKFSRKPWEGLFFAYLNMNRSLQAQEIKKQRIGPNICPAIKLPYALAISADAKANIRERMLAPSDNILDRSPLRMAYVRSKGAEQHLLDHLMWIFRRIGQELPEKRGAGIHREQPTVTLQTLEFCWGFFGQQPILSVLAVKAKMQSMSQKMRTRYFPEYRLEEGLEYDSPSVMMVVSDGIAIRCYAKAETTVRLEVVYSQNAFRKVFKKSGILPITEAISTVATVKHDAVEKMNTLLAHIHSNEGISKDDATVDELVENVLGVATDYGLGVSLLTRLAYHQRLAPHPNDPQYQFLRILKRRGVLMNEPKSPRGRTYVVTPRFRKARTELITSSVVQRRVSKPLRKRAKRKSIIRE